MTTSNAGLAASYYAELACNGDFKAIPMADDFSFSGPLHNYRDGNRYRIDCTQLAAMTVGLNIRHQFVEGDQVHTVYDLDLGLPSGPIATSESLEFENGVMVGADLIIDSSPLRQADQS